MLHYLVENPSGKIYIGSSMRRLTTRINEGIKDKRRWLHHQGLSWLKSGKSIRGLYKMHTLYVFKRPEERNSWLAANASGETVVAL